MNTQSCTDINIVASDDTAVNRAAALNVLKGLGYSDGQITEIKVSRSTEFDAETFGAGGAKSAPASCSFIYIGKS